MSSQALGNFFRREIAMVRQARLESSSVRLRPVGVSVVIPCLNEELTIGIVVKEALDGLKQVPVPSEVIVADNGSTDKSRQIAEQLGARVVPVPRRGYGAALDAGIRAAKYEWAIYGDADGSYPFNVLALLVEPLAESRADLVLGSRLRGKIAPGAMPFLNRWLGTPVLSAMIRLLFGAPVSDCNSGMRAIRVSVYENLEVRSPGMEFASELLIRAIENKARYAEVPIPFRKDLRDRPPHLRRWRDGWRHLRFILGNASTRLTVLFPGAVGLSFLGAATAISFQPLWGSEGPVHFHSAFVAIALSVPLLMTGLSAALIQTALVASGAAERPFVSKVLQWSDRGYFAGLGLGILVLLGLQVVWLFAQWALADFGALSAIEDTIRLCVLSILFSSVFTLDIGVGIIQLQYPKAGER
jgi:hypothetical protein